MAIRRTTITVTGASGGSGTATANAISKEPISGEILAVHLKYTDSPPVGTTDVTIAEANNDPAVSVLAITNGATDGWRFPRAAVVDTAGAAVTGAVQNVPISDYLKVTIAQANDNDGVIATIVWRE